MNVGSLEGYALAALTLLFVASLCYSICRGYAGVLSIVRSELEHEKLATALRSAQDTMEETSRETEEDLATAREMQMRILPAPKYIKRLQEKLGICVEAYFEPSAQPGGDYWYIFPQNETVAGFAISDFAGHGVQAALNTFSLAALLSRLGSREPSPSAALMCLNAELCPLLQTGQYTTALLGEIDLEHEVKRFAGSGGQPPLIYVSRSGEIAAGNPRGLPVGISRKASYENREMPFRDGDLLVLYSDAPTQCEGRDGKMIGGH